MVQKIVFILLLVSTLAACSKGGEAPLIAQWRGGSLDRAKLDRHIVTQPADQRSVDPRDPEGWWKQQAEDAILQTLLLEKADSNLTSEFETDLRRERRRLVAESEIVKRHGAPGEPSEEILRGEWDKVESALNIGERRELFNIFLRADNGRSQKAALREMEGFRQAILSGRSFEDIAVRHSDSESRHRRGFVGVFEATELDPRLADIVFSLPLAKPSRPITTNDGVHLFLVRAIFPGRSVTYEESRPDLIRRIQAREHRDRLDETANEIWRLSEHDLVFEVEEIPQALQLGPDQPILRIGDYVLSRSDFISEAIAEYGDEVSAARLIEFYLTVSRQEMILQGILKTSGIDADVQRSLESFERRLKAEKQLELELRASISAGAVENYFTANANRFARPPESRLRKLEVPLGASPVATMARLERARVELGRGRIDLEGLASELGGTVEDLGWLGGPELKGNLPTAPADLFGLQKGEYCHPFSTGRSIVVLEVVDTVKPRAPSLEEVHEEVVKRYIADERARLLKRTQERLFEDSGVVFEKSWLEDLQAGPTSPSE